MSGAATGPEFDPRYDPRFQRGWGEGDPDGAGPAEAVAVVPGAAESEAAGPVTTGPAAAEPAVSEPAAEMPAPPEPEAAEPVPIALARSAEAGVDRDADPGPEFAEVPGPTAGAAPDLDADADPDAARILRVALGIAWAIAGAATVLGAGLVWSIVSVDDPFGMPNGQSEIVLRSLAQFAAPALLSTGLLGIVALTVVDGLLRARRIRAQRADGTGEAP